MGVIVDFVMASQHINRVKACPTGVGNGVQTAFGLLRPSGILVPNVRALDALRRNDWQGNQLLYPTPRTNYLINSAQTGTGVTITGNWTGATTAGAGPDGGNAITLTEGSATGTATINLYTQHLLQAGESVTATILVKVLASSFPNGEQNLACYILPFEVNSFELNLNTLLVNGTPKNCTLDSIVKLPNNYIQIVATWPALSTAQNSNLYLVMLPNYGTSFTGTPQPIWDVAAQLEINTQGAYIPTAGTPVTLTDYTLSGTTVNLAQAPVNGATLNWDGSWYDG